MVLAHNVKERERTQDIRINQDITFDTMLLTPCTLQGLKDSGFYKPSPIQLHAIPLGKCGFDLLLEAKSGTGKTAVFTIIALEKIDLTKGLQVIILAPTREIAMQICDVLRQIGATFKGLCVEVVMGGLSVFEDIEKFKKNVHIVVASPGRLKHLLQDKHIDTTAVRLLILDEADKLMEKSFQSDINYIQQALPKQKQVIMSSATYPEDCKNLIKTFVHNAQHICPDNNNVLLGIEQKVTLVKHNSNIVRQTQLRYTELLRILANRQFKQCLIFCNYQARVGELYKMLKKENWPAEQLYGQQNQMDRLDALKTLQEYKCRLLISTDLAARGIDASNVDLVINFEPPIDWQTYLHRIGRAGRFGSYGFAVTILSEGAEQEKFKSLLESIKPDFQLTDLWSNAQFCINNNFTDLCLTQEINIDDLNKENILNNNETNKLELWDVLTSDGNKPYLVESFGSLFNELESCEKLEPFNELLESFNINENSVNHELEYLNTSNKNCNAQTFEHPELTNSKGEFKIEQVCSNETLKTVNNDISKFGTESCKIDLGNKENFDKQTGNHHNLTNSAKYETKQRNEIEINRNKMESPALESKLKVPNHHNSEDSNYKGLKSKESQNNTVAESEVIFETLADFDLPTTFGSSKHLNSQNKLVSTSSNIKNGYGMCKKNRNLKRGPGKISESSDTLNETITNKYSLKNNASNLDENIAAPCNTKNYLYKTKSKNSPKPLIDYEEEIPSTSKYVNRQNEPQYYQKHNQLENQNTKQYYNQMYIKWYNLLKLRVKHLEFNTYINELKNIK
ncbi:probable ATP-dependent RNA helicase DDX20 [Battus philenor]|uniref:probable ATP-dependent RNA helicase DDX20 n=1 Tax=Battus philenor TaxID=42288 RepID=UPI0035CF3043